MSGAQEPDRGLLLIARRDKFAAWRREVIARRIEEALALPRAELDCIERAFGYVPAERPNGARQ